MSSGAWECKADGRRTASSVPCCKAGCGQVWRYLARIESLTWTPHATIVISRFSAAEDLQSAD